MNNVYKVSAIALMLTVLVVITACGPTSLAVRDYEPTVDISGLKLDKSQSPHTVYIRPGAPGFGDYNRFIIDPVVFIYTDPDMKELSPEQVGRMQQYLRDAMIKELRDAGYEVGTKSQAGTMRMSFTISGLTAPLPVANVTAAMAPFAVSVGDVTAEWVLRESLSNRIDGVAVTRARGSRVLNPSPWSTWADVEKTFDNWAKGFREAVDKAHGR
jgi:hypothetical protein